MTMHLLAKLVYIDNYLYKFVTDEHYFSELYVTSPKFATATAIQEHVTSRAHAKR
jgi:hypothetical protein